MTLFPLACIWTALLLGLVLYGEGKGVKPVRLIAKPLCSTGFLVAAVGLGAHRHPYGMLVLVALALSSVGDVLLIPRTKGGLLAGIAAFLSAHVVYVAAFLRAGVSAPAVLIGAVALLVPAALVVRRLWPHVPGGLRPAVAAYVLVITAMVAAAAGTAVRWETPSVLVAAVLFYLSDLSVARDRFLRAGFLNRIAGLPLYYAAQLLFAWTARAH